MANKYFWDSVDISSLTGYSNATDYKNSSNKTIFASFPGVKNTLLADYEKYTSDDTDPPFYDNGTTIFRNIKVHCTEYTSNATTVNSTETVFKPSWANACKIYVQGRKGTDGNNADGHSAVTGETWPRFNHNKNHNNNRNNHNTRNGNRKHNDRNRWININTRQNWHADYAAAAGSTGGIGGSSKIYSTAKSFPFDSTDTIKCILKTEYVEVIIKRGANTIGQLKISNGTDGGNAIASSTTNNPTDKDQAQSKPLDGFGTIPAEHNGTSYDDLDAYYKARVPCTWNENYVTINAAVDGSRGTDGLRDATVAFDGYSWTLTNNPSNNTRKIGIHWFKI